ADYLVIVYIIIFWGDGDNVARVPIVFGIGNLQDTSPHAEVAAKAIACSEVDGKLFVLLIEGDGGTTCESHSSIFVGIQAARLALIGDVFEFAKQSVGNGHFLTCCEVIKAWFLLFVFVFPAGG